MKMLVFCNKLLDLLEIKKKQLLASEFKVNKLKLKFVKLEVLKVLLFIFAW